AVQLSTALSEFLRLLNMPAAEVVIQLKEGAPTLKGQDSIQFLMRTNKGEKLTSVKEEISGGELCRLLFAIKVLLANKNHCPTLIFDEIDANVGGTTATIMGEKLSELSQKRQILTITHFAQVARFGKQHIVVEKQEVMDRTITHIQVLEGASIGHELARMM